MKIKSVELYHLKLPLVHFFETSFGRVAHQETLIVRLITDKAEGYGEVPASAGPYYSYETVRTAAYIIKDFLAPLVFKADKLDIGRILAGFKAIRGHNMAKGGIEMALWDLQARLTRKSLAQIYGGIKKYIPAGISLGIEDSINDLLKRINSSLKQGYRRIKVKIKPGWDVKVIGAIRKSFPDIELWADANGAYELEDWPLIRQLDNYNLTLLEQPLRYDDIIDHGKLQTKIKTPICLDESIKSFNDARQAVELGACKIINIKQARVGGFSEAKRIHDYCLSKNVPVWCGGLLESGIGRLHNIALAGLPGFILTPDISESKRFYQEDIIEPPVALERDGTIAMPDETGLSNRVRIERIKKYAVQTIVL